MTYESVKDKQEECPNCDKPFSMTVDSKFIRAYCRCGWIELEHRESGDIYIDFPD